MGLGDFINRYIVEVKPAQGAGAPPPRAEDPPEVRARAVQVVPGKRNVQDVMAEMEAKLGAIDPAIVAEVEGSAPTAPAAPARAAGSAPARAVPARAVPASAVPARAVPAPAALPDKDPHDDGGDPPVSVEQVYAASKLGRPAHGFTLEKIASILADPRMAALDPAARAGAIAVTLEAAGVKLEDVVADAVARDAALDKFEGFLTDKLISLQAETERDRERLEEEIERLLERKREELSRLGERTVAKERELARFRRVKREEERRLFEVVRAFTADNPISITPVSQGGVAPAREAEGKADTGRFPRPE